LYSGLYNPECKKELYTKLYNPVYKTKNYIPDCTIRCKKKKEITYQIVQSGKGIFDILKKYGGAG